ncbi:hypothetical protein XK27_00430 [Streptococcus suis]|nr:hypothetical protein A7J10_02525 [Streptococcus suis]KPA69395.1 hypothetical protein XK27_00430 [Streptococcus suis]
MNKQELEKQAEALYTDVRSFLDNTFELIDQIDQPQTVVVPKFVAEWYERNKDDLNTAIYSTITKTYRKVNGENDDLLDVFEEWLVYEDNSILILIQMQFFGFEIEQEKLYTVEIPNPNRSGKGHAKFRLEKIGNKVVLVKRKSKECYQNKPNQKLTESEIKKAFEWAWQFAKEVE